MGSYRLTSRPSARRAGEALLGGGPAPGPEPSSRRVPALRSPRPSPQDGLFSAAARHVLRRCRPPCADGRSSGSSYRATRTGSPPDPRPQTRWAGGGAAGPGAALAQPLPPRAAGPAVSSRDPSQLAGNFLVLTLTVPGGPEPSVPAGPPGLGPGWAPRGSQTLCGQLGTLNTPTPSSGPPQGRLPGLREPHFAREMAVPPSWIPHPLRPDVCFPWTVGSPLSRYRQPTGCAARCSEDPEMPREAQAHVHGRGRGSGETPHSLRPEFIHPPSSSRESGGEQQFIGQGWEVKAAERWPVLPGARLHRNGGSAEGAPSPPSP